MAYKDLKDPRYKEARRRYYYKNKEAQIRRQMISKTELREWVNHFKEDLPCGDCGRYLPPYVMDFDHRSGETKIGNISRLIGDGRSLTVIQTEIDKCDLVCANCHRIRTHGEDDHDWRIAEYQYPENHAE